MRIPPGSQCVAAASSSVPTVAAVAQWDAVCGRPEHHLQSSTRRMSRHPGWASARCGLRCHSMQRGALPHPGSRRTPATACAGLCVCRGVPRLRRPSLSRRCSRHVWGRARGLAIGDGRAHSIRSPPPLTLVLTVSLPRPSRGAKTRASRGGCWRLPAPCSKTGALEKGCGAPPLGLASRPCRFSEPGSRLAACSFGCPTCPIASEASRP